MSSQRTESAYYNPTGFPVEGTTMQDFEKMGAFYLGRTYDLAANRSLDDLVLYDGRDLTTHAVCVGMTGSGKTGLCIALLEEAAIDGVPALVIDPKGDLGNLLLAFPDLAPADFAPWVDADAARRAGMEVAAFAAREATTWREGLATWGQDGARIRKLRDAAEFTIYTPGSTAGRPISILHSLAAPPEALRSDGDLLRDAVGGTATSLLGLLGLNADPLQSREHILLSTLLQNAWEQGQDLDLATLIQRIQSPPVQRIGVMELESVFPAKDRFGFATALNNLLAAPGFAAWMQGEPLDVGRLLHTETGKPRIAILSIAHLGDAERMFFVSLLLQSTLGWMRQQSGTSSLRAILYMDEIFGYFPPTANPPSKAPLLTLMKQARAYGLGVVLATQNPVDLDYKGLANAGTWFIGRLQTERDKARLLDGLEGAAAGKLDRATMEKTLSALGKRIFLLHDVHEPAPQVFESRWAMSYLRGPLTREQIKQLVPARAATAATPSAASAPPTLTQPASEAATVLPPEIAQHYLPVRGGRPDGAELLYAPMLLGAASLLFADAKLGIDQSRDVVVLASVPAAAGAGAWADAREVALDPAALGAAPSAPAARAALPPIAAKPKSYDTWRRELDDHLYRSIALTIFRCSPLGMVSKAGESERDFRIRMQEDARVARDAASEKLRAKYAPKSERLQAQLDRAQAAHEREKTQLEQQKVQAAVSLGATVLGAFLGRKRFGTGTIGRATTTARGVGRARKEAEDVERAEDSVATVQRKLTDLDVEFQAELADLGAAVDPQTAPLETISLRPKKTSIAVRNVALVWAPHWRTSGGGLTSAWE